MIRAILFSDRDAFLGQSLPGSTHFDLIGEALWFYCPCRCGARVRIPVGYGAKPDASPSWAWNGNLTEPTLFPSVNRIDCGWHGWLRDGYWQEVA